MDPVLFDVPAEPLANAPKPVCGGRRFRDLPARDQLVLRPRSLDEMVAPEDPVRIFDELLGQLDVSAFEARFPGGGAPAYPPAFVLKLLVFAMAEGVRSARQLALVCSRDVRFMWLAHGLPMDHELFSDFRTDFGDEIERVFAQTVALGLHAGLITMRHVSVDGSKIAAHANRKAYSEAELTELVKQLQERAAKLLAEMAAQDEADDTAEAAERKARLPKDLADIERRQERLQQARDELLKKGWGRISETDFEAPLQKTQDGKRPGYNAQIAVDGDSGMVVHQGLTDAQNDTHELAAILAGVVENTGFKPDVVAADSGYQSAASLQALEAGNFNGYVNQPQAAKDGRFGHEAFSYDGERDLYVCPGGHELPYKGLKDLRYEGCRVYRSSRLCCRDCPRRAECLPEKAKFKQLVVAPHAEQLQAMRRKLKTEEGQAALKRRFATVEPTFGVMKSVLGLRQFLLVGQEKAAIELALASVAINMRKLVSWALKGGSLGQLQQAPAAAM
ncbi:MAG: IS1182 family transposase [Planctomycetota bacterium]|nr:IS1182 family transposase [Planctomycetota bacterium]